MTVWYSLRSSCIFFPFQNVWTKQNLATLVTLTKKGTRLWQFSRAHKKPYLIPVRLQFRERIVSGPRAGLPDGLFSNQKAKFG
jgi:hypothetical protein